MSGIEIRVPEASDDAAIGELLVQSYTEQYAKKLPEVRLTTERLKTLRDIESKRKKFHIFIAEYKKRILGTVTLLPPTAPENYDWIGNHCDLRFMAVHASARGTGLSNELMQHAIDFARKIDTSGIILHTRQGATGVSRFYQKLGFRRRPEGDVDNRPEVFLEAHQLSF